MLDHFLIIDGGTGDTHVTLCPIWTDLLSSLSCPVAPGAHGFQSSADVLPFPPSFSVTTFLPQMEGSEPQLLGTPFLASDVPWFLFRQLHVKANKIRSGWRCDKVSTPMAVPGLWQAPGQAFSDPWVVADKQHQSPEQKAESRRKVKGSWEQAPRPPATMSHWDTVNGGPSQVEAQSGGLGGGYSRVRRVEEICSLLGLQILDVLSDTIKNILKCTHISN